MVKKLLIGLSLALLLCGCSNKADDAITENKAGVDFSGQCAADIPAFCNLVSEQDRTWFAEQLELAGVEKNTAEQAMSFASDYNEAINYTSLDMNSFQSFDLKLKPYDSETIEKQAENIEAFRRYNCKITAFHLLKSFVDIASLSDEVSPDLEGDIDAITSTGLFDDSDLKKYKSLFGAVKTVNSTNVDEHIKIQQDHWENIGVSFDDDSCLSLVTVHAHIHFSNSDNRLIVGHAGVLLDSGEELLFFEKLSPTLPYQLVWFRDRNELKDYLNNCYNTSTPSNSAPRFILENGKIM